MQKSMYKLYSLVSLLLLSLLLATSLTAQDAAKKSLTVHITNFTGVEGTMYIKLVYQESAWKKDDGAGIINAQIVVNKTQTSADYVFKDIPADEAGVFVFIDSDANKKLSTNFIGMPKEYFGFTNNPRKMGFPDYKACKLNLSAASTDTTITMVKL